MLGFLFGSILEFFNGAGMYILGLIDLDNSLQSFDHLSPSRYQMIGPSSAFEFQILYDCLKEAREKIKSTLVIVE